MDHPHVASDRAPLTNREEEVLGHLALGRTNAEIAAELQLSVHAIKFHLQQVFRKLGVANRTEAAVYYTARLGRHD
jgi:DNA-binding NarL/FixJ family response regulator